MVNCKGYVSCSPIPVSVKSVTYDPVRQDRPPVELTVGESVDVLIEKMRLKSETDLRNKL